MWTGGAEHLARLHRTHDHQRERLGNVVAPVEGEQGLSIELLDDVGGAQHGAAVRVAVEHHAIELSRQVPSRCVFAPPHFLDDDFLLELQLGLVEGRIDADVGEHLDRGSGARRRQHRVIEGEVERGSGVHAPADALDVAVDEAPRASRGPLEQHVLEIVRQTKLRRGLVPTPGTHPQLDCNDFTGGVLLNEDAHPVMQHVSRGRLDRGRRFGAAGDRAAGEDQPAQPERQENSRYPEHIGCQATTAESPGRMPHPQSTRYRAQRHPMTLTIPNK